MKNAIKLVDLDNDYRKFRGQNKGESAVKVMLDNKKYLLATPSELAKLLKNGETVFSMVQGVAGSVWVKLMK